MNLWLFVEKVSSSFQITSQPSSFIHQSSNGQLLLRPVGCIFFEILRRISSFYFSLHFFEDFFSGKKRSVFWNRTPPKWTPPPFQRELNFQPSQQFLSPKNEGKEIPGELGGIKNGLPPYCFGATAFWRKHLPKKSVLSPAKWRKQIAPAPCHLTKKIQANYNIVGFISAFYMM